jgi:hypothetical protein
MAKAAKKKSPKQLLAEAEAALLALAAEKAAREKELGDTIARLAGSLAECKALLASEAAASEGGLRVRESALRVELAAARARVRELEELLTVSREAGAAASVAETERMALLQQCAEVVASREHAERVHASEKAALVASQAAVRMRFEEAFKVRRLGLLPASARERPSLSLSLRGSPSMQLSAAALSPSPTRLSLSLFPSLSLFLCRPTCAQPLRVSARECLQRWAMMPWQQWQRWLASGPWLPSMRARLLA